MSKIWLGLCLAMLSCQILAQQTIKSKGDNNTNINAQVVVNVTVNNITKNILKRKSKEAFGDSDRWQGILVHGSDKIVPLVCPPPPSNIPVEKQIDEEFEKAVLTVRAGGNEFSCTQLPCNILRTTNKELLWVDRKKDVLTVGARVLGKDGTVLAGIENNKFYVNRNRTWRPPYRDDKSSLRVVDEKDNTVLKLRFANASTLLVEGYFNDGAGNSINVLPDSIHTMTAMYQKGAISDNCLFFDYRMPGFSTSTFIIGGPVVQ